MTPHPHQETAGGRDVARAWCDAVGKPPADRRVQLQADGSVADAETGEIIGELRLKRLIREAQL